MRTPAKLPVVVTMSTLASLVTAVGGDLVEVSSLVPVGASVENYEPRPSDVQRLERARVLFENGAGLEAWLDKTVRSAGSKDLRVVVLADSVPAPSGAADRLGARNPHLWMDPIFAARYVDAIAKELARADPAHSGYYGKRAAAEKARLAALDAWTRAQIATIPADRRSMIAFHDAFYYFDRRYGLRDVGAVETAPGREPSAAYFSKLVAQARAYHVRALFAEPQFSPKLIRQLADSAGFKTVTDLYDDTVGDTPELSNYEGIMRYDVRTIVGALK